MRLYFLLTLLFLSYANVIIGQSTVTWSLERCISYARTNNLSIQQSVLNERVAKLQWEQSRWTQLPNASLSSSYGKNFGRSIDPTSNQFINSVYDFTGTSGSVSTLLFGWFQKRNTIAKNDLLHAATEADYSQLQNDISLNVTTGYLRILLAKEQIQISRNQLEVSNKQVHKTEEMLIAQRSNGLDLAQVKTQLSNDSATYFKATLAFQQSVIDLKAILNLNFTDSFDVLQVDKRDDEIKLLTISPQIIYTTAIGHFGSIRSSELKTKSAESAVKIAKSNYYPQLSISFSSGTNYSSNYQELLPNGTTDIVPWGKQLQNNLSQSVYLGLNIPIFNGLSSRYAVKQAKITFQNYQLQDAMTKQKLKQNIYEAYNDLQTAYQTYQAAKAAATSAQTGQDFAGKRYEMGLISALDLLLAQNTLFKANADKASDKYDLIFKEMVIEYYLGRGIFE